MKGHKDVIPLLLSKSINVDVRNELGSPLQYAAAHGDHDTVKVLLGHGANAGADPNGGPDGVKPFSSAAEVGVIQIIKLLVDAGADPNVTNRHGLKPTEVLAVNDNRRGVEVYTLTGA
ncbi:hypothetical protein MKW98_007859 [Papaver atlanticum]|uniref:Ankyrin n=1 Tax=Papaver atlanticum TaxID=357466 RepID=A0AAD4X6H8_9MAGN|nr:hypothetical protein MKW98_007859 [Papaver atlanticum]